MGSNADFKHWKKSFLTFLSLKAAYFILKLAIKELDEWLDEATQNHA
jgi:uncharacterized protein YpmS